MVWLARILNDQILAPFNLRIICASNWNDQQRRNFLAIARTLKLGCFLMPQKALGQSKIRVGSDNDGGYVCLDDFNRITLALS